MRQFCVRSAATTSRLPTAAAERIMLNESCSGICAWRGNSACFFVVIVQFAARKRIGSRGAPARTPRQPHACIRRIRDLHDMPQRHVKKMPWRRAHCRAIGEAHETSHAEERSARMESVGSITPMQRERERP
jgi:hypothetical protein